MNKADIDLNTQTLLRLANEEVLTRTIWALTPEQKHSPLYRQIGEQRYLSALRIGAIDNAEMTKTAFKIDPFFLKSRIVTEAMIEGVKMKLTDGQREEAERIRKAGDLPEEIMGIS